MIRALVAAAVLVGLGTVVACREESPAPPTRPRTALSGEEAQKRSIENLQAINRALTEADVELPDDPLQREEAAWAHVRSLGLATTSPFGPAPDAGADYALDMSEVGSFRHDRIVGVDRAAYLRHGAVIVTFGDTFTKRITQGELERHLAISENRAAWERWGLD